MLLWERVVACVGKQNNIYRKKRRHAQTGVPSSYGDMPCVASSRSEEQRADDALCLVVLEHTGVRHGLVLEL